MATRQYNLDGGTISKANRYLYCRVVVPTPNTGAPVLQKWNYGGLVSAASRAYAAAPTTGVGYAVGNGEGIRSVVRNSAGNWTVTLSDSYQRMTQFQATFTAAAGTPAAPIVGVISTTNVQTFTAVGNGGVINLLFQASAGGGATDPAAAEIIDLEFTFNDATEP